MKYILIIGDGMADNPLDELGGKTPLEAADIPEINALAAKGEVGTVRTVPHGVPAGSDTAILSIFGCDPLKYYTGRSPLEAAGGGIKLGEGDVSYRCNMVCLSDDDLAFRQKTILSHSGGSVDGESSIALMEFLINDPDFARAACDAHMTFYPNPSFRHIACQKKPDITGLCTTPPHDVLQKSISAYIPNGCENARMLCELMELANTKLQKHPINEARRKAGKLPANGIWFWAEGTAVELPDFYNKYGKKGAVVSAVPLVWGIGSLTGQRILNVAGANGEIDTDYEGKVEAAFGVLENGADFAALHIEAPDECSHAGDLKNKIIAINLISSRVFKPFLQLLEKSGTEFRLLFISDHKTLISTRTHDGDPVPFMLYDSRKNRGTGSSYNEKSGLCGRMIEDGTKLMDILFEG